jgi:hypothetical protein
MKIVKPYGRSHVDDGPTEVRRRAIRTRDDRETSRDIVDFAKSHDELVIAQWISTIDKIATKPADIRKGATEEQHDLRMRLGEAAWALIERRGLLPGLDDPEKCKYLRALWNSKIAPYGKKRFVPKGQTKPQSPKGRWYRRFTGDCLVERVDAAAVAQHIHSHLYEGEYRLDPLRPVKRTGRIDGRAESIAGNVLKPQLPRDPNDTWTDADWQDYASFGDVAGEIREAAKQRESGVGGSKPLRVGNNVAGVALYRHYARVFKGNEGAPLSIADARTQKRGLFAIHQAVRDCYRRILKDHKKGQKAHGQAPSKVSRILPGSMDALHRMVRHKEQNRDINALIRLGKVIHYHAGGAEVDRPVAVLNKWPTDVAESPYWSSHGQAAIKRNEAFVRVWRHALSLARVTATDWADPDGRQGDDILGKNVREAVTGQDFDRSAYARKIELLFGSRAELFRGGADDSFARAILGHTLKSLSDFRNSAFHFKRLDHFIDALAPVELPAVAEVAQKVDELWHRDRADRANQRRATMRAAHLDRFFEEHRIRRLDELLAATNTEMLPLPRFARMLRRAENARKGKFRLPLPPPANRWDMAVPAIHCRYTILKLLYEGPFRAWLGDCAQAKVKVYIDRAVKRTTGAAIDLNAGGDPAKRLIIRSRAEALADLEAGDDIASFFGNLSAETASEMRVQRGYDSDPDNAREQADYIEDLKADVVALAFCDYLADEDLGFVRDLPAETVPAEEPLCDLETLPVQRAKDESEPWQRNLYFLLHLLPVEEAGRLLHQIRKWRILAGRKNHGGGTETDSKLDARALPLAAVLELYIEMHDAKFEGGNALVGTKPFAALFDSEEVFARVFPETPTEDQDRRVPKRGLREIMRFGHLPALLPLFEQHPITTSEVTAFLDTEEEASGKKAPVAQWQERRAELHAEWVRQKRRLSGDELRAYVEALTHTVEHRHRAAHVTLTDHVRLHRLLLGILGRMVDYSGMWERDLYFVTLAAMYKSGETPSQALELNSLEYFGQGQIVLALSGCRSNSVKGTVEPTFGAFWKKKRNRMLRIRNAFAHFNMLRARSGGTGIAPVDLTEWTNGARDLMAYDRKLKNAVTRSVKDLLQREGLNLNWTMDDDLPHRIGPATVATRQATHLNGQRLTPMHAPPQDGKQFEKPPDVAENLHGLRYLEMVAALFSDCTVKPRQDVMSYDIDSIDWNASARLRGKAAGTKPPGK